MPNIKSAKKRLLTSEKARQANAAVRTQVKNTRRKFQEVVAEKNKEGTEKTFKEYCSILDNAAKKGVIKKNTAIRRKRRASASLRSLA